MTLIRAPWWATNQAFSTPTSCPVYCFSQNSEFWDFEDVTFVSGQIRSTSTITGSNGTVLIIDGPSGVNLGFLESTAQCYGLKGLSVTGGVIKSTAPVMSTSHPYTVEIWFRMPPFNSPVTGTSVAFTQNGFTDLSWYVSLIVNPSFVANDATVDVDVYAGGVCGPPVRLPLTNSSVGCFKIRFSVDPCNHKYSMKIEGAAVGFMRDSGGFRHTGTSECIEILRSTASPYIYPPGSGFPLIETRRDWPELYGCEPNSTHLEIVPFGVPIYRLHVRAGYEAC